MITRTVLKNSILISTIRIYLKYLRLICEVGILNKWNSSISQIDNKYSMCLIVKSFWIKFFTSFTTGLNEHTSGYLLIKSCSQIKKVLFWSRKLQYSLGYTEFECRSWKPLFCAGIVAGARNKMITFLNKKIIIIIIINLYKTIIFAQFFNFFGILSQKLKEFQKMVEGYGTKYIQKIDDRKLMNFWKFSDLIVWPSRYVVK